LQTGPIISRRMATTSGSGPSQHFAPPHDFGRKPRIAEVDWQPSIAEGDARDPNQTWRAQLLDHLVGAGEDGQGYDGGHTSRLALVHGQLPSIQLLNRKIGRWGALENAGGVFANASARML
jgi:hypothetical protein